MLEHNSKATLHVLAGEPLIKGEVKGFWRRTKTGKKVWVRESARAGGAGDGEAARISGEKAQSVAYAKRAEGRAKKYFEQAKKLERKDFLHQASMARKKGETLMKLARMARRGTGTESKKSLEANMSEPLRKSAEEIAVAAVLDSDVGQQVATEDLLKAISEDRDNQLQKAVVEVETYGRKTTKKTIPDKRLLEWFAAYLRNKIRDKVKWNEATDAQAIYDSIVSSSTYENYVAAAIDLLEKKKAPFTVATVERVKKQVDDATRTKPEPTNTTAGSERASGG